MPEKNFQNIILASIAAALIVYITGWFNNVMEIDAAQYAAMSLEMLKRNDFLTFTDHGKDYLDKPPMIFWLSGLSMQLLGANNVAYRLPAFLATILALYATYRFTILYYSRNTGLLAALILATTQAIFLINHDVRTDTNLMTFYIFSIWQIAEYLEKRRIQNLLLGFAGIGLAMLSKGPIGLIAPAMAFLPHIIIKKQWRDIANPAWLIGLVVTAMVLLPMSYGLYQQFDLQPNKLVNGQTGTSGLRFFYWTQSFGRITGESSWSNNAGPFFLTHSTLWAFAPWSLFLVLGIALRAWNVFRNPKQVPEFISLFGFLLPFAALSASRYQLPHYAFVVYPLGAVLASIFILRFFYETTSHWSTWVFRLQTFLLSAVLVGVCLLVWIPFPKNNTMALVMVGALMAAFSWTVFKSKNALIVSSAVLIIGVNLILNTYFYPNILQFQAGSELGEIARVYGADDQNFYSYDAGAPHTLNFYSKALVRETKDIRTFIYKKDCLVYTEEQHLDDLRAIRPDLRVLGKSGDFRITMLKGKFLNPETRPSTLTMKVLVKL